MKETGIIMSGNHPRLILDGLKSMTRRTWGLEKINENPDDWVFVEYTYTMQGYRYIFNNFKAQDTVFIKCPYGGVGDRLWIKETHVISSPPNSNIAVFYPADNQVRFLDPFSHEYSSEISNGQVLYGGFKKKPSIFMPRWASRILREITEVKAERLWDITEEDMGREGIAVTFHPPGAFGIDNPCATGVVDLPDGTRTYSTARGCWIALWDSINAKSGHGWDRNEWVWPIRFKVIDGDSKKGGYC